MLFELNQDTRSFRARFNGETPDEVVKIISGLSFVCAEDVTLMPIIIQGDRIADGRLGQGVDLDAVRTMVESALSAIPAENRSADNDSLEFRFA